MRKNRLIVVVVFLAVACLVIFLILGRKPEVNRGLKPIESVGSNNGTPNAPAPESAVVQKGDTVLGQQAQWLALFANPVVFYGKIVDQHELPIDGAQVELSFIDSHTKQGTTVHLESDSEGMFHSSGRGLGAAVAVSKKGYYRLPESGGQFPYIKAGGNN